MSYETSFENYSPPIPAKDIKEKVSADVVVLGAGIAGLTAAVSAAEAGAKTILLEKGLTSILLMTRRLMPSPSAVTLTGPHSQSGLDFWSPGGVERRGREGVVLGNQKQLIPVLQQLLILRQRLA